MKIVSEPITNSSNFYLVVLASRHGRRLLAAHELAYLAAEFFGSPAVKVSMPPREKTLEWARRAESASREKIINRLQAISPHAVEHLSFQSFSPLYKAVDYLNEQCVYVVERADALRFNIPWAVFSGTYASDANCEWRAFAIHRVVRDGIKSVYGVNVAVLQADSVTKGDDIAQWYDFLVRMGVAPVNLARIVGIEAEGWQETMFAYHDESGGVIYWQRPSSGLYVFVPTEYKECGPINELETIGYILNTAHICEPVANTDFRSREKQVNEQ